METLSIRKTHKFVGTWQHEDEWEYVGDFENVATVTNDIEDENGPGSDPCAPQMTTRIGIIHHEGKSNEAIEKAIHDTFTQWGCDHEWDCCGCRSYRVHEVQYIGKNYWRVDIYSAQNY